MKPVLFLHPRRDVTWDLARQIGIRQVIGKLTTERTGRNPPWDHDALAAAQHGFAAAGLELYGLEGDQFSMDRIKRGLPGRDEDLERYAAMVRNMGKLGIRLLCYNFMALYGWTRTRFDVPTRGGALTSRFDLRELPHHPDPAPEPLSADALSENYRYFLEAMLPVAEEAGVTLALHPDDPPLPELYGVARIFSSAKGFRWALGLSASPHHKITFCQANFQAMGEDIFALANEWMSAGRVAFVHWRDIKGTAEAFTETFHDDGPTDMPAILAHYHELGFRGPIRPDHVPTLAGEPADSNGYAMLGRLHAIGYLRGIFDARGIPLD